MNLTRETVNKITDELVEAANEIMKKYGMQSDDTESVTFERDGSSFRINMTFKTTDKEAIETKRKKEFEALCIFYGFKPEDYNTVIDDNGRILKFVGFNTKAKKNACVLINAEGKEFVAPVDFVKSTMKKN